MKALLIKDFYMAKKYLRSYAIMLAVFLAMGAVNGEYEYFLGFPCVMSGILTVSLVSYDERFHWDSYCDILPVSRRTAVSEKYVLTLIIGLGTWLISAGIELLHTPISSSGYFPMVLGRAALTLSVPIIMLPVIFKYGVEKGRIVYYIVLGFFMALTAIILPDSASAAAFAPAITWSMIPVVAIMFLASWLISVKVYEKREL